MTAPASSPPLSPECVEFVRAIVAAAPPLRADQRTKLGELLRPARTAGTGAA